VVGAVLRKSGIGDLGLGIRKSSQGERLMEIRLESLRVWQTGREFTVYICKTILPMLPREEKYILNQQLRRSSQSVPANIAEAHGRYHYQDAIRFFYIARGSLDETICHLLLASDLGYINHDSPENCRERWRELHQLLNGYINYLDRKRISI
jgi:four helix bundle protein